MSLQPIDSLDAIRQALINLDSVILYGLKPMYSGDAEKIVATAAILRLVEEAQNKIEVGGPSYAPSYKMRSKTP